MGHSSIDPTDFSGGCVRHRCTTYYLRTALDICVTGENFQGRIEIDDPIWMGYHQAAALFFSTNEIEKELSAGTTSFCPFLRPQIAALHKNSPMATDVLSQWRRLKDIKLISKYPEGSRGELKVA